VFSHCRHPPISLTSLHLPLLVGHFRSQFDYLVGLTLDLRLEFRNLALLVSDAPILPVIVQVWFAYFVLLDVDMVYEYIDGLLERLLSGLNGLSLECRQRIGALLLVLALRLAQSCPRIDNTDALVRPTITTIAPPGRARSALSAWLARSLAAARSSRYYPAGSRRHYFWSPFVPIVPLDSGRVCVELVFQAAKIVDRIDITGHQVDLSLKRLNRCHFVNCVLSVTGGEGGVELPLGGFCNRLCRPL
jgi:hypothetical protein